MAVYAQAHTGFTGAATSIGEQPLKGLIDPEAMARLALGEAVTNLCLVGGGWRGVEVEVGRPGKGRGCRGQVLAPRAAVQGLERIRNMAGGQLCPSVVSTACDNHA